MILQLKYFWRKNAREVHQGGGGGGWLLQDKAPAHREHADRKKLPYLGFQCLDYLPYSPDLSPSDYRLFPGLKKN